MPADPLSPDLEGVSSTLLLEVLIIFAKIVGREHSLPYSERELKRYKEELIRRLESH